MADYQLHFAGRICLHLARTGEQGIFWVSLDLPKAAYIYNPMKLLSKGFNLVLPLLAYISGALDFGIKENISTILERFLMGELLSYHSGSDNFRIAIPSDYCFTYSGYSASYF